MKKQSRWDGWDYSLFYINGEPTARGRWKEEVEARRRRRNPGPPPERRLSTASHTVSIRSTYPARMPSLAALSRLAALLGGL